MSKILRACVIAALAAGVALGAPGVALAADQPTPSASPSATTPTGGEFGCLGATDDYGVPLPCELHITLLSPICDNDVPKLRYVAEAIGTPNTTVTITWVNPGGANVVQSGLPLSGTVLWPGAVVGPDGKGADWPGWRQLPDGSWVEGDEFDWVRPSVQVNFQVNPSATMSVAYPPSSPNCATNPPGSEVLSATGAEVLSATGSNSAPLLVGAVSLVVVGGLVVLFVARRRHAHSA
ncbi:peptidase [Cellulomonas sp.]|uniref:peptidase n=1 Tax=Cellulomonas sp. TaxID=40001 RepID=UPI001B1B9704|nr:peptidase [Cellulomonas sp.]MBO9553138.1 peptidase [Cellulomonas sp.]